MVKRKAPRKHLGEYNLIWVNVNLSLEIHTHTYTYFVGLVLEMYTHFWRLFRYIVSLSTFAIDLKCKSLSMC